jgi:predicted transglutaminase-like cysteine proteinase
MSFGFARIEKFGIALAAVATLGVAFILALAASSAKASEPLQLQVRLFGSTENVNLDISPFPKWTQVLQRYESERHLEDAPCTGACPLQRWKGFVQSLAGQNRLRQLDAVNAYINRIPYQTDASRWGMADYWATPREILGRTADCEDYAIAKYLSLRKLGWAAHELRLVVLKDEVKNELHAVLIAYHNGTAYVLDNLLASVTEHAAIRNYRPIFSINEIAWHFHRDWNPGSAVSVSRAPAAPQVPVFVPAAVETRVTPLPTDTVRPAPIAAAARAYARGPQESLASIFSNAGTQR